MSKKKLFDDDSDEEINLKTENEYAKKYDNWREKEEIHKLEQKYGPKALKSDGSESSDSEDDSDEPPEVSEEMEQQFLKTLSLLKTKDPRIYDSQFKFFDEEKKEEEEKPKTKTLTFEDSDDDDEYGVDIFKIEKKAEIDEEEKVPAAKASGTTKTKGKKIKEFLTGKSRDIDEDVEKDLAPLKALWSDPKLNEGEAFLRDYILNKRYLEDGDAGDLSAQYRDDADLEADEKTVEEQAQFERAYNFRFEEPDDEYLKRFPRTMNYIRPKDDRRSRKRAEVRARKDEEKKRKMEEIARLKALKLKEIQEKIAKIKEVTGNQDLAFEEEDIEGDFDPEAHDRRMAALFGGDYYGREVDDRKPQFPDLDDELEIENWDKYEFGDEDGTQQRGGAGPHCEDDDFNMDADYNPTKSRANLLEEIQKTLGKKRRNRKRKSKLAELLSSQKPKYVPGAQASYAQFMDEYYKMDCEDVIGGDLTTRFKYREVVPNDYGLTVEEILLADDKELTQWVPLKRIVRIRPDAAERSDCASYKQRAADLRLKKKLLPSLFKDLPNEPEIVVPVEEETKKKKRKKKRKKKNKDKSEEEAIQNGVDVNNENPELNNTATMEADKTSTGEATELPKKKKKKHKKKQNPEDSEPKQNDTTTTEEPSPKLHKTKRHKENPEDDKAKEDYEKPKCGSVNNDVISKEKRKKKKHKSNGFVVTNVANEEPSLGILAKNCGNIEDITEKTMVQVGSKRKLLEIDNEEMPHKKKNKKNKSTLLEVANNVKKKNKKKNQKNLSSNKEHNNKNKKNIFKNKQKDDKSTENPLNKLSDERLKAYGLNPKKYRGFLKYKKF